MNFDNKRLILLMALGFVLLLIWQAWQQDYGVKPTVATAPAATEAASPVTPPVPLDVPTAKPATAATKTTPDAPPAATMNTLPQGDWVRVKTDVLDLAINTVGGDLRRLNLLAYPVAADQPEQPFPLLNDAPDKLFIAQSGLLAGAKGPDHHAVFIPEQTSYQLASGANELKVRLNWSGPDNIKISKIYTLRRASYEIKLDYEVHNGSAQEWRGRVYGQFQRVEEPNPSHFIYTYSGGVLSSPENKYEKINFSDMTDKDLSREVKGGWAAMLQHYFVGAWIPEPGGANHYYSKALEGPRYVFGVVQPEAVVAPGQTAALGTRLYAGPKLQDHLQEIAPNLELTVDYGMLTILAQPIFWLLKYIHNVVGNWGWAIAILTLLIKLAFYRLSAASYRSMANMRRMQPRILALKERYGEDRQKMSQAMMELYKTEKINPLGGCLPVLVQIPVFIALYWVLLESVELRQADFILWIYDLSSKDPYYVLPLLMGATMLIQQKLSPAPPDPIQAKVMTILPIVFTLFFAFFPAGLVLYWVVNNALSIAQQWYITRKVEAAASG